MEVDDEEIEVPSSSSSKGEKKRFEVKKVKICGFFFWSVETMKQRKCRRIFIALLSHSNL
jgi:RING-box protein 1